MKRFRDHIHFGLFVGTLCFLLFSGFITRPSFEHAKVEKRNGLHVFFLAEPVQEYEVIGQQGRPVTLMGLPEEILYTATKRAAKRFPEADGIIFPTEDMRKAKVIRFKK